MKKNPENPRLHSLLHFAKSERDSTTWRDVAANLGDLYHPSMTLPNVLHHLTAAYSDALCEPRFAIGRGGNASESLLASPLQHLQDSQPGGRARLDSMHSVETFYNAFVIHILGQLAITSIGWCRDWYDGKAMSLPKRDEDAGDARGKTIPNAVPSIP